MLKRNLQVALISPALFIFALGVILISPCVEAGVIPVCRLEATYIGEIYGTSGEKAKLFKVKYWTTYATEAKLFGNGHFTQLVEGLAFLGDDVILEMEWSNEFFLDVIGCQ